MWPRSVKDEVLVLCGRSCCICHGFCGTKIELHHIVEESKGGSSDLHNCIPLCFNCHADVGHYNPKHPKGTKYSESELRMHRERWYDAVKSFALEAQRLQKEMGDEVDEVYEGQEIELTGFVWREAFPGPPNYKSFEKDSLETYWMLVLPKPISLLASGFVHGNTFRIDNVKKLQLVVSPCFYDDHRNIVLKNAKVKGKLFQAHTGHHRGDACFEVVELNA
ncbi:DUF4431 domain-containing protein [Shewanella zhangzhouensis]|uniref:DUF4431 domain-containing protein n=1 Tax=Shewanella zhangzhouensis TaxID=2864213 RepID=UPI001C65A40F|nr:DUF4431 domain-containing protein [Shewanella zhangzhouensis]QYK04549.1 DUF4431 domain-containing protein [Shewanella zhangzhouensis]